MVKSKPKSEIPAAALGAGWRVRRVRRCIDAGGVVVECHPACGRVLEPAHVVVAGIRATLDPGPHGAVLVRCTHSLRQGRPCGHRGPQNTEYNSTHSNAIPVFVCLSFVVCLVEQPPW